MATATYLISDGPVQTRLYTVGDLADLEATSNDNRTTELHGGVLVEMPGSQRIQARLASWIAHLLSAYVMSKAPGGEVLGADGTCVLSPYDTRIPEVSYLSPQTAARQPESGYIQGAPDFAVEVVSPTNTAREMQVRAGEYLAGGARLVWIVNVETRTVDVYRPGGERLIVTGEAAMLDGGDVLPGFTLSQAELFNPFKRAANVQNQDEAPSPAGQP